MSEARYGTCGHVDVLKRKGRANMVIRNLRVLALQRQNKVEGKRSGGAKQK